MGCTGCVFCIILFLYSWHRIKFNLPIFSNLIVLHIKIVCHIIVSATCPGVHLRNSQSVCRMKMVLGWLMRRSELRWTHLCLRDTIQQPVDCHGRCTTSPLILNISRSVERKWTLCLMKRAQRIWNGVCLVCLIQVINSCNLIVLSMAEPFASLTPATMHLKQLLIHYTITYCIV